MDNNSNVNDNLKNLSMKVTMLANGQEQQWKKLDKQWEKLDELVTTIHSVDRKVAELPCSIHVERMKKYDSHIDSGQGWRKAILGTIVVVVLSILSFAVTWGQTQQLINSHVTHSEERLRECCDAPRGDM